MQQQEHQLRIATFITCVGQDALRIYNALPFESEEDKANMDIVLRLMERHCLGETNVIYERFRLNQRIQAEGETFDEYLTALKELGKTCQYGQMYDDMIRDRLVVGIRDNMVRKQLLQKKELSLVECVDTCRANESTTAQVKAMTTKDSASVHRIQGKTKGPRKDTKQPKQKDRERKYCGRCHWVGAKNCPAYGKVCGACSRRNHFASVCRSAQKKPLSGRRRTLHVVEETTDDEDDHDSYEQESTEDHDYLMTLTLTPQETVNVIGKRSTYPNR